MLIGNDTGIAAVQHVMLIVPKIKWFLKPIGIQQHLATEVEMQLHNIQIGPEGHIGTGLVMPVGMYHMNSVKTPMRQHGIGERQLYTGDVLYQSGALEIMIRYITLMEDLVSGDMFQFKRHLSSGKYKFGSVKCK